MESEFGSDWSFHWASLSVLRLLSSVFFVMSYAFFIFLYHNLPLLSCITFPLLCAQLLFLYIVSLGCQRSVPPAFSMFQLLFSFLVYVLPIVFYLPRGIIFGLPIFSKGNFPFLSCNSFPMFWCFNPFLSSCLWVYSLIIPSALFQSFPIIPLSLSVMLCLLSFSLLTSSLQSSFPG